MNRQDTVHGITFLMTTFLVIALTGIACAGSDNQVRNEPVVQVSAGNRAETILDITIPELELETVRYQQKRYTRVQLPGAVLLQTVGLPELPTISRSIAIPHAGNPDIRIIRSRFFEIPVAPVIPSLGHLTRDVDPAARALTEGKLYSAGGIFPAEIAELSDTFLMRDVRGVTVRINPVRYDADRGVLLVLDQLTIGVTTGDETNGVSVDTWPDAPDRFTELYQQTFANFPDAGARKYSAPSVDENMLIICHDEFAAAMVPFVEWKRQRGIAVEMIPVSATDGTAQGIKYEISQRFDGEAGLTYVILVGDREEVPTNIGSYEQADSDGTYALLAGDDLYPDVFISRISASTTDEVAIQVAKFIAYEKTPGQGIQGSWYSTATGIASNQGNPPDWKRAEELRDELLAYGFSDVDRIYEGFSATSADITNALNEGRGLVNYLGHGTGVSWSSVSFNRTDIHALENVGRTPVVIDISCSNGDFALDECFAEAWLRTGSIEQPRGAVGVLAASTLAPWIPPTIMQAEIVDRICAETDIVLGALYYAGLARVLDEYSGQSVARQVMEQNNIFGDCSLMIRTAAPEPVVASHQTLLPENVSNLDVNIDTNVEAVVTITRGGTLLGREVVMSAGPLTIPLSGGDDDTGPLVLTITGINLVPYISTITVAEHSTEQEIELPTSVTLEGNFPNPFNPQTTIVFTLPEMQPVILSIYDVRGNLINTLVSGNQEAGRHSADWSGLNDGGYRVPSGIYFYRLQTEAGVQTGKMLLSK